MTEKSNYQSLHDLAEEVAHDLLGTCKSLTEALGEEREHLRDDSEFCHLLDERVMECHRCNWWSEPSDGAFPDDEFVCSECLEDHEKDDE